jgi:hypothetical protein
VFGFIRFVSAGAINARPAENARLRNCLHIIRYHCESYSTQDVFDHAWRALGLGGCDAKVGWRCTYDSSPFNQSGFGDCLVMLHQGVQSCVGIQGRRVVVSDAALKLCQFYTQ